VNADELLQRLQAADPAAQHSQSASWIPDLLEATMSTPLETPAETSHRRRRWVAPAAAAVVLVASVTTFAIVGRGDDRPAQKATTSITLAIPATGTTMTSCIPFSVGILKDMPVAFSGTVGEVTGGTLTLEVDHWYRGGTADTVKLNHYDASTVSIAGIEFSQGQRYLITATNGTVNFCGYSALWSEDMAAHFDQAFNR
jgi:hypothetical protein